MFDANVGVFCQKSKYFCAKFYLKAKYFDLVEITITFTRSKPFFAKTALKIAAGAFLMAYCRTLSHLTECKGRCYDRFAMNA